MIRREKTEFILSATSLGQVPTGLPQVAFTGRSNVGKSSLMNALVGRKKLVKTSSTPGKTRELNFFTVDEQMQLVDLPGFGYAKFSKDQRAQISRLIEGYIRTSVDLKGILYLIDLRTSGTVLDQQMVETLASSGRPMLLVGTKGDKLNLPDRRRALSSIQNKFRLDHQPHWVSSETRHGIEELWSAIEELIKE